MVSIENAAQISEQDILFIAFSKMVRSPLTSGHRLRDGLPHVTWKDMNFRGNIQQYLPAVMSLKPLTIYNKVLMSYLKCTYIVPVNFCQNFIT